ncbi:hypothetical protein KAR91_22730 [Candidatus Pacearchaeota archaeon]|nr:hypothetical protein [Candidatus Pacearchaeota archaeon]
MKTAIYIEDGTAQLVITPESDFEKNALSSFEGHELKVRIFSGSFYDCRGGWLRQVQHYIPYGNNDSNDKSLILRIDEEGGDKQ